MPIISKNSGYTEDTVLLFTNTDFGKNSRSIKTLELLQVSLFSVQWCFRRCCCCKECKYVVAVHKIRAILFLGKSHFTQTQQKIFQRNISWLKMLTERS